MVLLPILTSSNIELKHLFVPTRMISEFSLVPQVELISNLQEMVIDSGEKLLLLVVSCDLRISRKWFDAVSDYAVICGSNQMVERLCLVYGMFDSCNLVGLMKTAFTITPSWSSGQFAVKVGDALAPLGMLNGFLQLKNL